MATEAQIKNFVEAIGPIIAKYAKQYGYKVASPVIAQAIHESGVTSTLATKYFNYFGLKCGSSKKGAWNVWDGTSVNLSTKEEYTVGTLTTIRDNFRVYKNMDHGVQGYFEFIGGYSRYKNLKDATTPMEYLNRIKQDGYATSSSYVTRCMAYVEKYNLTRFDNFSDFVVGQTYTLQANMYVRHAPNGQKVLFESMTDNAKKNGYSDEEGGGILRKDTRVTCKDVVTISDEVWIKIPSGYICAKNRAGRFYVK